MEVSRIIYLVSNKTFGYYFETLKDAQDFMNEPLGAVNVNLTEIHVFKKIQPEYEIVSGTKICL